jgi:hypothetical protein
LRQAGFSFLVEEIIAAVFSPFFTSVDIRRRWPILEAD